MQAAQHAGLDISDLFEDTRRISRHLLLELSWARALERGLSKGQPPCLWLQLSATPPSYSGSGLYNSHTIAQSLAAVLLREQQQLTRQFDLHARGAKI